MKLIFKGIVQGVGFRPTIYRIAKRLGLKGYVLNTGSEVEVIIDKNFDKFIKELKRELPKIAKISEIDIKPEDRTFTDFKILHSKKGERKSLIPADVATCNDCIKELMDKNNRRYQFPFTNCTVCGARYSLIKDVPYDRVRTSMDKFKLCKDCESEYKDPSNRRYHAQTISCPKCGPKYTLYDTNKNKILSSNTIQKLAQLIDDGKICVIKSWGGMHLCCRIDEIKKFREWYGRPQKSFAIMVRDIKTAKEYGEISKYEEELLLSDKKPIVIVKKKKAELASPGLNNIGLFLPYTGLHTLLFSNLKSNALIMTSANLPGEPMLISNNDVFSLNADYYLLHNRDIPNRVDDTVLRLWKKNIFFLRKSRGYVPDFIPVDYNKNIVSVGAGENITGAISVDSKIYTTQYIGNSKYYAATEFLENSINHMKNLFMKGDKVDAVVMDLHPGYDSRQIARNLAKEYHAQLFEVQHHWAHAASLLVDNNIKESLVLTLDGPGYGTDKTFWGGEVFRADFEGFERVAHLEYLPLIGGDKATRDPKRLVFAIFQKYDTNKYFNKKEAEILEKLMEKSPISSSLGRYLDALSCYLGICNKRTYSGEPAIKLEKYLDLGKDTYQLELETKKDTLLIKDLFIQIDELLKLKPSEKQKADISYCLVKKIIDGLTDIAVHKADEENIKTIGVTGGVSYNIPIVEMVEKRLKNSRLKLVVHNNVPNGDGGISIGQNAIFGYKLK